MPCHSQYQKWVITLHNKHGQLTLLFKEVDDTSSFNDAVVTSSIVFSQSGPRTF